MVHDLIFLYVHVEVFQCFCKHSPHRSVVTLWRIWGPFT